MEPREAIIVFVKPPEPGVVKTRLAAEIGAPAATDLAAAFYLDTVSALEHLDADLIIAVAGVPNALLPIPPRAAVWSQGEGDLGQRLERALRRGLDSYDALIIVGTDSPGLPPTQLAEARAVLRAHDAVLGPCEDGGFYLIGMRRCPELALAELPWSREETFACTLARLTELNLTVAVVSPWFDVDHLAELERLRRLLDDGEVVAPATAEALRRINPSPRCP